MFLFNLTSNCNLCRQAPYILTSFLTCAETETAIDVEAESAGEATDDEVPEAESARDAAAGEADDEVLGPQMVPVGIFQMPSVGLGGVVEGISRLIDRIDQDKTSASGGEATDGVQQEATRPGADDGSVERISERGTASGGDTPDGAQQETTHSGADDGSGNDAREQPPLLRLARDTQPCNDYEGGPDSIYMAWWPLMPLRRAFTAGQKIPRERWRHLYLYFDNRFANDLALLFHSASVLMRLAVNSAVSARVKSSAKAFKDWEKLMKDQGFRDLLARAGDHPESKEAREVMKRINGILQCVGRNIPWSNAERSGEMTKFMALTRWLGGGSFFYTVSPDPVHNIATIQWSAPFTGWCPPVFDKFSRR